MSRDPVQFMSLERLFEEAGFDVRSVTWGYQDVFRRRIQHLLDRGLIGPDSPVGTALLFEVLRHTDKSTFDSVLKSFLDALVGPRRWLLRLPRLFERWCRKGLRLAKIRHFLGMKFFEATGAGELGESPRELEFVLDMLALILEKQPELAGPFIDGYPRVASRLGQGAIRGFVFEAMRLYVRNPETGSRFLSAQLSSSSAYVERMSRQVTLGEIRDDLERFARALCGRSVEIEGLGSLDADELMVRGSGVVACATSFYLPGVLTREPTGGANLAAAKTLVAVASACWIERTFTRRHAEPGFGSFEEYVVRHTRNSRCLPALATIAETVRVLVAVRHHWPGLRAAIARFLVLHAQEGRMKGRANRLLVAALGGPAEPESLPAEDRLLLEWIAESANRCCSFVETTELLQERLSPSSDAADALRLAMPDPLFFFPDLSFPMEFSTLAGDSASVDLHDSRTQPRPSERDTPDGDTDDTPRVAREDRVSSAWDGAGDKEEGEATDLQIGYFYPEWNIHCADYYEKWCCVRECRVGQRRSPLDPSPALRRHADQVRRIFERLRPEEVRRIDRLREGDDIQLDHLVEYMSERAATGSAEMRFYTKPLLMRRDVAVGLLLDLSGSTAQDCEAVPSGASGPPRHRVPEFDDSRTRKTVLRVEKEAAFVLGSGLQSLGDAFGVFGFTGTSRENCQFFRFKDFHEPWDADHIADLLGAFSGSSTRIGAALRHAGWKLARLPERTRLLLLITDGKPCDQGYDPQTRYAHHDVRKACEENRRNGIHTFCISTSENTPADMQLMFPGGRYLILDRIARLPAILSRLYLHLTR